MSTAKKTPTKKTPTKKAPKKKVKPDRGVNKFTIDRNKWLCARDSLPSSMQDSRGNMCCLGFYAKACGVKEQRDVSYPRFLLDSEVEKLSQKIARVESITDTPLCDRLVHINDTVDNNAVRERRIAAGFRQIGVTVKFVGKYRGAK